MGSCSCTADRRQVACQTIAFGRGVCGKVAQTKATQLVKDVHAVADHIACDGDSRSEIVVPMIAAGRVVGVLDVDSTVEATFDEVDREYLEKISKVLAGACDW